MSDWTLFSNHGHVLVCLSRNSEARLRDVALDVGITERAVQKIVRDLQDGGMISVTKNGRRNSYRIHRKTPLRHDLESACTLKDLINFVNKDSGGEQERAAGNGKTGQRTQPVDVSPEPVSAPDSKPPAKNKPARPAARGVKSGRQDSAESGNEDSPAADPRERQQGFLF